MQQLMLIGLTAFMTKLMLTGLIVLLIVATKYLYFVALRLGSQKYLHHLIFDDMIPPHLQSLPLYQKLLSFADVVYMGTFIILAWQDELTPLLEVLYVFVLMKYVIFLGTILPTLLIYRFVIKNPDEVSGQVYFKPQFVHFLQRTFSLHIALPLGVVAYMTPSPYSLGSFLAAVSSLIVSVRKQPVY